METKRDYIRTGQRKGLGCEAQRAASGQNVNTAGAVCVPDRTTTQTEHIPLELRSQDPPANSEARTALDGPPFAENNPKTDNAGDGVFNKKGDYRSF